MPGLERQRFRDQLGTVGHGRPWQGPWAAAPQELAMECGWGRGPWRRVGKRTFLQLVAGAGQPGALFTAQCSAALVFMSFVRLRSLCISYRFWGVTSKVRKLWKEFFPHESHFPKKCKSPRGAGLLYRAGSRTGTARTPGEFSQRNLWKAGQRNSQRGKQPEKSS